LDQPELGVDVGPGEIGDPTAPQVGQRFYCLDIPGKRPLMVPLPGRRSHVRHRSRSHITFHFPKNQIVARLYLSEIRAQQLAVKLRQHAHMGTVAERLHRFIERGVNRAFAANLGIKIIHGAVVPGQAAGAFNRLPALVPQVLRGRITEWLVKAVAEHLQKHAQEFIAAADNPADGVTLVIVLHNPPGFRELGEALKARGVSLTTLRLPPGEPTVALRVHPATNMPDLQKAIRVQLQRQVVQAAARLADLDDLASSAAWHNLEQYLGLSIRRHLYTVVTQLVREGESLQAAFSAAKSPADLADVRHQLLNFRNRYARVEMTLMFFADAINTRTSPKMSGYLKACDILAYRSMSMLLDQLRKPTPNALS
jgi:hypothetical protein